MCIYSTDIDNDKEKYWKLEITKRLLEKSSSYDIKYCCCYVVVFSVKFGCLMHIALWSLEGYIYEMYSTTEILWDGQVPWCLSFVYTL